MGGNRGSKHVLLLSITSSDSETLTLAVSSTPGIRHRGSSVKTFHFKIASTTLDRR